jgi:hypothetical protein
MRSAVPNSSGTYEHLRVAVIEIVTITELLNGSRLEIPMSEDVLKEAKARGMSQIDMFGDD